MLVLSCAVRSPATPLHTVPPLATSALSALLCIYVVKVVLTLAPYARLALRPAKP
jgi:NADH:ubiquinone oxidoreductase subunit 4 (subunit M)